MLAALEHYEAIIALEPYDTIATLITLECYEIIDAQQYCETIVAKFWIVRMFLFNELKIDHSSFQFGNLTLLLAFLLSKNLQFFLDFTSTPCS